MSSSIIEDLEKTDKETFHETSETMTCFRCGGNGYVKSSLNCYHTCLDCFAKGYKELGNFTSTIK